MISYKSNREFTRSGLVRRTASWGRKRTSQVRRLSTRFALQMQEKLSINYA